MGNDKFNKGIEDIKKIKLSSAEKNMLSFNIEKYVGDNPIPEKQTEIKSLWYIPSHIFSMRRISYALVSILIICIISVSAVSASQNSLPGDILYPIKVDVLEPLKYAAAPNDTAKAKVEADNVLRRIGEAEALEKKGNLTDSSQKQIESSIVKHSDSLNKLISNSQEASSTSNKKIDTKDFEQKIDNHLQILDKLEQQSNNKQKENINKIKKVIIDEIKKTKDYSNKTQSGRQTRTDNNQNNNSGNDRSKNASSSETQSRQTRE